jgi:hypothetical protein
MGHEKVFANYFTKFLVYGAKHFKRYYEMQRSLFLMIMHRFVSVMIILSRNVMHAVYGASLLLRSVPLLFACLPME